MNSEHLRIQFYEARIQEAFFHYGKEIILPERNVTWTERYVFMNTSQCTCIPMCTYFCIQGDKHLPKFRLMIKHLHTDTHKYLLWVLFLSWIKCVVFQFDSNIDTCIWFNLAIKLHGVSVYVVSTDQLVIWDHCFSPCLQHLCITETYALLTQCQCIH